MPVLPTQSNFSLGLPTLSRLTLYLRTQVPSTGAGVTIGNCFLFSLQCLHFVQFLYDFEFSYRFFLIVGAFLSFLLSYCFPGIMSPGPTETVVCCWVLHCYLL